MTTRNVACVLVAAAAFGAAVLVPEPVYTHKPITTNILFKNEIAQIFQRKCFQCHTENNLAMALTTYTQARPWARAIREEILDREMPPWQAIAGYGHFSNDVSLNLREREIILSWADGGAPSGVLKAEESIPPVYVPPAPVWDHGEPDLIVPIADAHKVAAGAPFALERFVVDVKLPGSRRVRAIGLKQGDRRVVRHASFYEADTGQWLGGWTPWQTISEFADNVAVQLAANARIAVEVGYVGVEEDVIDRSELGLYFADSEGSVAAAMTIQSREVTLSPGSSGERIRAETKLAADTTLVALWPQPGAGATSVEITAVKPDGMMTPLLWINEYRSEWPSAFYFATPVVLPRGSRILMTTYHDGPTAQPVVARPQAVLVTAASPPAAARRK